MKCHVCGSVRVRAERGEHKYSAADGIIAVLLNVEFRVCEACGDRAVVIPNITQLNEVLAKAIAQMPVQLAPSEIRFLRKSLGFSGTDFAHKFGVANETVSRWENGVRMMSAPVERFLRYLVLTEEPISKYPLPDKIKAHKTKKAFSLKVRLDKKQQAWERLGDTTP